MGICCSICCEKQISSSPGVITDIKVDTKLLHVIPRDKIPSTKGDYIYCMVSLAGLNWVKVGRSNDPSTRINAYVTAHGEYGVRCGFSAVFQILSWDKKGDLDQNAEAIIHDELSTFRCSKYEFFDFHTMPNYIESIKKILDARGFKYTFIENV